MTHEPSELVYVSESPSITAAEIARQRITDDMVANLARLAARQAVDNDET